MDFQRLQKGCMKHSKHTLASVPAHALLAAHVKGYTISIHLINLAPSTIISLQYLLLLPLPHKWAPWQAVCAKGAPAKAP